ncbi:MAG TPA: SBBP repeat-containing protein, partial [Candidatus Lokiarchaeia archaeon]|nr:SBBP repeat-containing protein [Candidatus Lokiarchaeia archaeon]
MNFSTYLGGSSLDEGYAITVDTNGCIYIVAQTYSSNIQLRNANDTTLRGSDDAYVCKINPNHTINWSTYLGGSGDEGDTYGFGITTDQQGNCYVVSDTKSPDFPLVNPLNGTMLNGTTLNGTSDAFISEFSPTGLLIFSTYFGGSGADSATEFRVNSTGYIFIAGDTHSSDFPLKNPYPITFNSAGDGFLAILSPTHALVWSTYFGASSIGSTGNSINAMAITDAGAIYFGGSTASNGTGNNLPLVNPV